MPVPRRSKPAAAEALVAVAPLAARWIERLLAGHKPRLTVPQFLALRAIERERPSAGDLALRAGISEPAVSQLLAGLDEAGLIERSAAPDDRRRRELTLSTAGERVYRSAEEMLHGRVGELLGDLPPPEADALARALPQVEALLSGVPPPRRPPPPPGPPPPRRLA